MTARGDDEIRDAFGPGFTDDLPPTVDEAAVRRLQRVARVLDDLVRVPGTDFRLGLDPILGSVPVVGDILTTGLSLYVVLESARLGVSYTTLLRMLANVGVDAAVGSVPVVGPLFDAVWKVNKRNLGLALADLTDGAVDLNDVALGEETAEEGRTVRAETATETSNAVVIEVETESE